MNKAAMTPAEVEEMLQEGGCTYWDEIAPRIADALDAAHRAGMLAAATILDERADAELRLREEELRDGRDYHAGMAQARARACEQVAAAIRLKVQA